MFVKSTIYLLLMSAMLMLASCLRAAPPFIWAEGELPANKSDIVDNSGFNGINPYGVSGGVWLRQLVLVPDKFLCTFLIIN